MRYPILDSKAGQAIWSIICARMNRGASDEDMIKYLERLKIVWKENDRMLSVLDGYIDGFKAKI